MKKILCLGDSNTYGYIPETSGRYDKNSRWSGILSNLLISNYEVIENGCNNRTAFINNKIDNLCGFEVLKKLLKNSFYDILVLSIGINDLQINYNVSLKEFKNEMEKLINFIKSTSPKSKIILICPTKIKNCILNHPIFSNLFDTDSIEKSKNLSKIYSNLAHQFNLFLLDLNKIIEASDIDGLHYSIESHKKIASELANIIAIF